MEVGDIIDIPPEYTDLVNELMDKSMAFEEAMDSYTQKHSRTKREAWEFIKKILPETAGFGMKYLRKDNKIILAQHTGLRHELERTDREAVDVHAILQGIKEVLVMRQEFDDARKVRDLAIELEKR